ncbi:hypothetical protein BK708_02410 [Bacillus thuringiensis serovar yunnanensis]|nr:hypothetical protein BK708_02410 [Bacillus thuringiensis serovar yunnanensis]
MSKFLIQHLNEGGIRIIKHYKLLTVPTFAAILFTGACSSKPAFATENKTSIQQVQPQHIFSSNFIAQKQNLDIISMNNLDRASHVAILEPEVKNSNVFNHKFNVKSEYTSKLGNKSRMKRVNWPKDPICNLALGRPCRP